MKKLASILIALTACIFAQEEPKEFNEMFYITMGSEIPMKKMDGLTRSQRTFVSIGMGIRSFIKPEHAIDVCITSYHHPVVISLESSLGYIYRPSMFGGMYAGVFGYSRNHINAWLDKTYRLGYKGCIGYQIPTDSSKSSFLDIGFDEEKNLSIRSGLLF